MPEDERPREKLAAHGADALADSELIAILLRTGIAGANAIEVARDLLKRHGSLRGLSRCSVDELAKIHGVGFAKAAQACSSQRSKIRILNPKQNERRQNSPDSDCRSNGKDRL